MPVRIYDIAKRLGIANKEVLDKAKELGIATAKVPSSSLDKITAEFLEQQLAGSKRVEPVPAPEPPPPSPPMVVISELPPPSVAPAPEPPAVSAPASAPTPAPPVEAVTAAAAPVAPPISPPEPKMPEPVAPPPPPPPAPPPGPKMGDKVGFIQLPPKPAPRAPDRPGTRFTPRAPQPGRTDFNQRGDIRRIRGGPAAPGSPPLPGQKAVGSAKAEPAKPAEPKFVAPAGGELITIKPPIVVRDLAEQLKVKPFKLIADLMELGVFASVNQSIDENIAQQICAKYGFRFEVEKRERGAGIVHAPVKKVEIDIEDRPEELTPRAPVVTIMGHVDHGKTTLLDVIRKANVAAGEAGGITQHIGAYTISFPHPERKGEIQQITFLDTPGHAAFSAMRARGANVTDIVILVVAANDGVMPQTLEALSHAQAAKVPVLVAVNKTDHPNANPLKVRQQLQDKGLVSDEWGGETIFVDVSALTKQGVDKLIEMILLQADLVELKANPNRRAKGNVIESGLEPGGPTATVLVHKGTLRVSDVIICGQYYGRVRALINEE